MHKALQLAREICQDEACQKDLPHDHLKLKCHLSRGNTQDRVDVQVEGKSISIHSSNPLALAAHARALDIASRAQRLKDFLGPMQAQCADRLLWLESGNELGCKGGGTIYLPDSLLNPQLWKPYAERVAELGYNGIIFAPIKAASSVSSTVDFDAEALRQLFADYGIRLFLAPTTLDTPGFKGPCFWQSTWEGAGHKATTLDRLLGELQAVEKLAAGQPCIFFLPSVDARSRASMTQVFTTLADHASSSTRLAFSAVAGAIWEDHAGPHPLWDVLRAHPHLGSTPLLPIVNLGGVGQGGGLWPALPIDMLDGIHSRIKHSSCSGMICLSSRLPKRGALLDCSLWSAAQLLWRGSSAGLHAETWLRAHYPKESVHELLESIQEVRAIVRSLSQLRQLRSVSAVGQAELTQHRTQVDAILARLNALRARFTVAEAAGLSFSNYICYFVRDAKRLLQHFIQSQHLSVANVLSGQDMQDSFWTSMGGDTGRGLASSSAVSIREQASAGQQGSSQDAIYQVTWAY